MHVVIEGQHYADGDARALSVPMQTPLLVIRDPPGGDSSVSYSRVETTVKINIKNYERYRGEFRFWQSGQTVAALSSLIHSGLDIGIAGGFAWDGEIGTWYVNLCSLLCHASIAHFLTVKDWD